ncbi:family 20 glycosylhydrolase [Streptomyces sp. TRM43335]|uniref:Family 20 glycosylhydrolase n=1 Tax=Streptomyces taklimakanensis TaxID=2569853 RepID=A0A6G2BEI6_9ACTN|nr:family 20 glycosylhydrolase [Streptomyces taklimakanensis]MTE20691.1 family 20 glycosylhydrolase [Streptomyces taklimakanensis]
MGRRRKRTSRRKPLVVAAVLAALATAVSIGILVLPDGDGEGRRGGGGGRGGWAGGSADVPVVTLPPAPETVPAVRLWEPESGIGWQPGPGTRVVADPDGELADEADLLAEELDAGRSDGPAGPGDVELVLDTEAPDDEVRGREGYALTTAFGRVTVTGRTDTGVFHGTRTLLQAVRGQGRMPAGTVRDWPDRPQRGFMLDIARKHFDAEWIEDRIREMADLKLNQLHLHLSDDQAFRVESDSHPEIVSDPHLTKAELRRIVELANSRHIAVIPEIDSPGHLGAVLDAHPELQLRDADGDPAPGAIDISDPRSARLLDDLLREYAPLFRDQPGPGPFWHLGGDEYRALMASDPEASYPELAEAARRAHGPRAGIRDLAAAWLNDRAATVREEGFTPQVWNDGQHPGGVVEPSEPRQVTYWTGKEIGAREPEEYLREGWEVVNLNDEYLYYVLGEPNQFTYPTGERIYEEWTPAVLRGTEPVPDELAGPDRIRGGRLAVWCDLSGAQTTEQVARGIRMPLRALAQKLWNPAPPVLDWPAFRELADRVT